MTRHVFQLCRWRQRAMLQQAGWSLLPVCLLLFAASDGSPILSEIQGDCGKMKSSYLWRIDRQPPAYLLGTIHVPYTAVWDSLSPTVLRVLDSVQSVHPEMDLTRSDTLRELARCQLIQDDATQLEDLLPEGMVERVASYLSSMSQRLSDPGQAAALSAQTGGWRRRRPIWLALSLASLTPADLSTFGTALMDVRLTQRAASRGQRIVPLESAQDQCQPLNSVPPGEAALALRLTLDHLERRLGDSRDGQQRQMGDNLVGDYRCGRLGPSVVNSSFLPDDAVASLSGSELALYQRLSRRLRHSLMLLRNKRMAEKIERRLRIRPERSMLFAVGVGHLLGSEHSIVTLLRSANFTLSQLAWNETDDSAESLGSSNQGYSKYPYSRWRYPNRQRESDSPTESEIWEEAKKFARLKWEQLKAERIDQEPASPVSSEFDKSPDSDNLINSATKRRKCLFAVFSMTILTFFLLT